MGNSKKDSFWKWFYSITIKGFIEEIWSLLFATLFFLFIGSAASFYLGFTPSILIIIFCLFGMLYCYWRTEVYEKPN